MLLHPFPVPVQQLLQGVAANLTATLPGSDGEPAPGLTVTVDITRADGTVIATGAAATDNTDGTYSSARTAAELAQLDMLTATWKVAGVTRETSNHEVVGGFYFSQADATVAEEGRASTDGQDFPTLRREVEAELERICGHKSFVPRYNRIQIDATAQHYLRLPHPLVRTVRSVRVYATPTSYTTFSAADLASITVEPTGLIERTDFGYFGFWTGGRYNTGQKLIVEYEHGDDRPPSDLKRAAIRRYRQRSNQAKSGTLDKAISYTAQNGATYRIATAGEYSTGDPDIDAIYEGYAFKANRYGVLA